MPCPWPSFHNLALCPRRWRPCSSGSRYGARTGAQGLPCPKGPEGIPCGKTAPSGVRPPHKRAPGLRGRPLAGDSRARKIHAPSFLPCLPKPILRGFRRESDFRHASCKYIHADMIRPQREEAEDRVVGHQSGPAFSNANERGAVQNEKERDANRRFTANICGCHRTQNDRHSEGDPQKCGSPSLILRARPGAQEAPGGG